MKYPKRMGVIFSLIGLFMSMVAVVWAANNRQTMTDSADNQLILAEITAGGGVSADSHHTLRHKIQSSGSLTQADYQRMYDEATQLVTIADNFYQSIQIVPSTTITEALQNYEDFNDGYYFYRFCANYNQIDAQNYCPESSPDAWPNEDTDIRNKLIRARALYVGLAQANPTSMEIEVDGAMVSAQEAGKDGILDTTRQVANIHLIFGNEYLIDALDYRFSTDAPPNANTIVLQEIDNLRDAKEQYRLATDLIADSFETVVGGIGGLVVGDFFSDDEFELFGHASRKLILTIDEIGLRHRQLGQDEEALTIYRDGVEVQYLQALAIATEANEREVPFLENGGWELANNLERLQVRLQAIYGNLDPFGYSAQYVPLYTFDELFGAAQSQFLRDATEDEQAAREAQRDFDVNATALRQELQRLRLSYDAQLLEMCGYSSDGYVTCEGGLMEQNYFALINAQKTIDLAKERLDQIPAKIQIEQDRAEQVIDIIQESGKQLAAISYAIGVRNSYKETRSVVHRTTHEWQVGVTASATAKFSINPLDYLGASGSLTASTGYTFSRTKIASRTKTWDPAQIELGELNGLRDVVNAATQAQIIGANSEAVVRNLLLEQANLLIQLDMAINEWNRISAEHNHLVEKYHNILGLREQAQEDFVESYLNNPAYRVLRDTTTVEAAESHAVAAQFAYLTARALEYEFLQPVPFLDDIYKARTADDIDNFLVDLLQWRTALGNPGYRNLYPYNISLAEDVLGLTDENLNPDDTLTEGEVDALRIQLFREFLQDHIADDKLRINFTTSIQDNNIFSPNVWNNRIAGVGLPADVPNTQGVGINIETRQFGELGTPEVILRHGEEETYRNASGDTVYYQTGPARLQGYSVPGNFQQGNTTAVILSSVNGNQQGTPSSALFNLSVAATNWTLVIDLNSPLNDELDLSEFVDITILMNSTAIAQPIRNVDFEAERQELIAEYEAAAQRSAFDKGEK